jgi:hypothetical protein
MLAPLMNTTIVKSDTPPAPLTVKVFTDPLGGATPETDRQAIDCDAALPRYRYAGMTAHAESLERRLGAAAEAADAWQDVAAKYLRERGAARGELSALRANLERLAARWAQQETTATPQTALYCVRGLRRVLAGETPPAPGQPWPAAAAVGPAALDEHGGGPSLADVMGRTAPLR